LPPSLPSARAFFSSAKTFLSAARAFFFFTLLLSPFPFVPVLVFSLSCCCWFYFFSHFFRIATHLSLVKTLAHEILTAVYLSCGWASGMY